ncbi:unnamed protein product [Sphagnum balticum]
MQSLLQRANVNNLLTSIEDGEEAIDYIHEIVGADVESFPDVLMLDINLPCLDGFDVLSEIRRYRCLDRMPIAVITTSEDPEDRQKALSYGASFYFSKPPSLDQVRTIFQFVDGFRVQTPGGPPPIEGVITETQLTAFDQKKPKRQELLLIEDNPLDAFYIEQIFVTSRSDEFVLSVTEDIQSTLKILTEKQFDLIIADLGLPDAEGLEVVARLNAAAPHIPIVILTGNDDSRTALESVKLGAQDFLVKGKVDGDSLHRSIKYAMTRKRAEDLARAAVTREKEILQEIVEHAPVAICRFDQDCIIKECNAVFYTQLGLRSEDVLGRSVASLFKNVSEEIWSAVLKDGLPFSDAACRASSPMGSTEVIWDIAVWPVENRDSGLKGGIMVGSDVSKRVELEQSREDFIAALAHDIKNPLVGTGHVLTSITSGSLGPIDDEHKSLLKMLSQTNDGILLMLHNLLDIYKFEAGAVTLRFEPLNLKHLMVEVLAAVAPMAAEKNIEVKHRLPLELSIIKADKGSINRLLSNLLFNALEFSPENGTITIEARNECDFVAIETSDQGQGMSKEEQASLFKRFGQGKNKQYKVGPSIGLGLYLCKEIVDAHHGLIECKSELGKGTTFTVRLPVGVPVKL